MATIAEITALLNERDTKLEERLDERDAKLEERLMRNFTALLDQRLAPITEAVNRISTTVERIEHRLSILEAKQYNASIGREQTLTAVPLANGELPRSELPGTILQLLVAGNEKLPNGGVNTWNKRKSHALLAEYGEDDYDTETENEHSELARVRRIKVARKLGVTQAQLNWVQLSLW